MRNYYRFELLEASGDEVYETYEESNIFVALYFLDRESIHGSADITGVWVTPYDDVEHEITMYTTTLNGRDGYFRNSAHDFLNSKNLDKDIYDNFVKLLIGSVCDISDAQFFELYCALHLMKHSEPFRF